MEALENETRFTDFCFVILSWQSYFEAMLFMLEINFALTSLAEFKWKLIPRMFRFSRDQWRASEAVETHICSIWFALIERDAECVVDFQYKLESVKTSLRLVALLTRKIVFKVEVKFNLVNLNWLSFHKNRVGVQVDPVKKGLHKSGRWYFEL